MNLSNPTDTDLAFTVSVEGLPAAANIDCREVMFTCTKAGRRVSGALRPGEGTKVSFTVPAGTVKQAWISFVKPMAKAGTYRGKVIATAAGFSVANVFCWLMNRAFVFRPGKFAWHVEFALFYGAAALATLIALVVQSALIRFAGMTTSFAAILEIVVSFFVNFVTRRFFIFKG